MKALVILCLLLGAAAAVRDIDEDAFCGVVGKNVPGGWRVADEQPDDVGNLMMLATDEYIFSNNGTDIAIPCADDYELPTEADIVCQQVVAGTNYKLLYSVECPDGTSTMMQAELYVPLPAYNEPTEVTSVSEYLPQIEI